MRAVKIDLCSKEYYLVFNGRAMLECEEQFGGASRLIEAVQGTGKEAFGLLCQGVALLAGEGELARRALSYDKGDIPTAEHIAAMCTPMDMIMLRNALIKAVVAGFGRQVEQDGDTDLVLLELAQKKTTA